MKKTLRKIVTTSIAIMIVGLIVYALLPQPIDADLAVIQRGSLRVMVEEDGKTRIRERYVVSAPLTGRLLRVDLDPGDPVERGKSRLVMIAPRDPELLDARELAGAEARVKAEEAALGQAEPLLERAKAALEYAESELGRARRIARADAISDEELEQAEMRYRLRQEDYRAARFAESIARYELEMARAALLRTQTAEQGDGERTEFELFSPINGRVLRVFQESATVVDPGTPLLELGDPADLEVEVDVLSSDAVKVTPGAPVLLEHWGGDQPLHGVVRLVEPSAFTKVSALGVEEQRVNVIIDFVDDQSHRPTLGDGFRVEARIVVWEGTELVTVPASALFREQVDWAVFVVSNDRARLRRLELGHQNNVAAEVVGGLEPDDVVILHPSDKIQDGTRIVPRETLE